MILHRSCSLPLVGEYSFPFVHRSIQFQVTGGYCCQSERDHLVYHFQLKQYSSQKCMNGCHTGLSFNLSVRLKICVEYVSIFSTAVGPLSFLGALDYAYNDTNKVD